MFELALAKLMEFVLLVQYENWLPVVDVALTAIVLASVQMFEPDGLVVPEPEGVTA
jgi:hypothetical protein